MVNAGSDSSPGDILGQRFGPYRLVRRLGVGGMAQTFEAVRHGPSGFSQHVCLKLVLPHLRGDEAFRELFQREAKLAARLRHSNIVGIIDFGDIDGTLYIALELVDGVDLQGLLDAQDRKRLRHDYVVLIGRDLARALEHAHNPPPRLGDDTSYRGAIIHRDISPSNVLISRHGEVMLTDFGVAKAVTDTQGKQSNVKGKIPYMPPEQLMGEPLDGRADLYAVGVVLFEALSGCRPYLGPNEPATIMSALAGNHVALSELTPDAPPRLHRLIESLIEPDRERRPESATALLELLDEVAPPPRARRELGRMVAQTPAAHAEKVTTGVERAGRGAVAVEELGLAEAPTESGSPDARPEAPAATPIPSQASTRWSRRELAKKTGLAMLALGGAAAGAIALWPEEEPSAGPFEESGSPPKPESEGEAANQPAPAAPDDANAKPSTDVAAPGAEESKGTDRSGGQEDRVSPQRDAAATRMAHVTVAVFPFGKVWINGKARGTAPLKNRALKPGVYKISAGQGRPSQTKTVRLHPGERKTVIFDLTSTK